MLLLFVSNLSAEELHLRVGSFDPKEATPAKLSISKKEDKVAEWIIQFTGPIENQWRDKLKELGVEIRDYVPENAYLVRMSHSLKEKVSTLNHIRVIIPFRPEYKIDPELKEAFGETRCLITLWDEGSKERVANEVVSLGGKVIRGSGRNLVISIDVGGSKGS
jgi:hypothetical protein